MLQRLTADQERFYRDQGYLIYDQPLFSCDKYNVLKAHNTADRITCFGPLRLRPSGCL